MSVARISRGPRLKLAKRDLLLGLLLAAAATQVMGSSAHALQTSITSLSFYNSSSPPIVVPWEQNGNFVAVPAQGKVHYDLSIPPPFFVAPANIQLDFAYPAENVASCQTQDNAALCDGHFVVAPTIVGGNVGNLPWTAAYNNNAITTNKDSWAYQYAQWALASG